MTGTGTQSDPYIVDNWSDFKQAAAINNAYKNTYVKFADGGGTIDMLEIYPDGITETISIYADVDGNGWNIKNLHSSDKRVFDVYNTIKKLNFIDCNISSNESAVRFILLREGNKTKGYIEYCTFSGNISGKYTSFIVQANNYPLGAPTIFGCACNLSFFDEAVLGGALYSQSCFYIDASNNAGVSPIDETGFHYCLIRGKMYTTALQSNYTQYSVFDIVCPSVSVKVGSKLSKNNFIIGNIDTASYNENVFYELTTEQLKDMEYLLSLGFQIGNEEITTTIINFENGGFDAVTGDESTVSGNQSEWIPITNTAIILNTVGWYFWYFKCRDADGNFRYIPTSEYLHISLNVATLTEYDWISEVKIGTPNTNTKNLNGILYNGYPWKIDSAQNDGLPFPALAVALVTPPPEPEPPPKPKPIGELQRDYITIYSQETPQDGFETHGLGVLLPTKCQITEELNGKWELSLEHPVDDYGKWDYIRPFAIIKALGQLFTIRLVDIRWTGNKGTVSAKADHIFYQLNDAWIHQQKIYLYSRKAAETINSIASITDRQIREGHIYYNFTWDIPPDLMVTENFFDNWSDISSGATFAEFVMGSNGLIVGTSGEIYRDNFYFSIRERIENANDQAFDIRVGKNLRGIKRTIDTTRLCTYFRGFDDLDNEYAVAYENFPLLSPPHYVVRSQKYSYNIDNSLPLDERIAKSEELLKNDVNLFFITNCVPKISYEVDLEDVTKNADYFDFVDEPDYRVGNIGYVHDDRLGGSIKLKITKTVKDAITGKTISVTFGDNLEDSSVAASRSAIDDIQITPVVIE